MSNSAPIIDNWMKELRYISLLKIFFILINNSYMYII